MTALSMEDEVLAARPDLSEASDLPAHARIASWLERLLVSGRLDAGDQLPPEVEMAAAIGVSRMTLRQALAAIESKGLIERRRGRFGGNFVAQPRFDFHLTGLPGFTEQMRRAHVEAGAHVVRAVTRPPSADVRAGLRLRRGERVHEVVRVRSANGDPITLEEAHLPARVFPGLLERDLTDSIYGVMERDYDRAPYSAEEVVEPVAASEEQAELLRVAPETPLLLVTRTSYAEDGTPVEYSRDYFRPDRTRIMLRTQVDHAPVADVSPTRRGGRAGS